MREINWVLNLLDEQFKNRYPEWARGQGSFPWKINLQPPTATEHSNNPMQCLEWAERWRQYTGPGTVTPESKRLAIGTFPFPSRLVLDTPADVAQANTTNAAQWRICGQRLIQLQELFPQASFAGKIRVVSQMPEADYQHLVNSVTWLDSHNVTGMLIRQLPLEGVDTKWLEKHAAIVLNLLGPSNDATPSAPAVERLQQRLGLRRTPTVIHTTVLCPRLREQLAGMRHFAAPASDLTRWHLHPRTVLILENKETGYAFTDDHHGVVVLHGKGFDVGQYAQIEWVREADNIIYWGDIDGPGLEFVDRLRSHDIPATTVLMDLDTLHRYKHLAVEGAVPRYHSLRQLTKSEQELYEYLGETARQGNPALLEQERIPWPQAYETVALRFHRRWDIAAPIQRSSGTVSNRGGRPNSPA